MTKKAPNPLQTPLPFSPASNLRREEEGEEENQNDEYKEEEHDDYRATPSVSTYPRAKLRLECRQLDHKGSEVFFSHANPAKTLPTAVSLVLSILYGPRTSHDHIPPTRSVTLVLRSMDGVAYTTGLDIDDDHKEIHFSLDYINGVSSRTPGLESAEIQGVLVHEMVHAWQWDGLGTAPVGLTEGIADFVRLKAGLSPPHWKKELGSQWDAGYQHTAYFLAWMEEDLGKGSVGKINAALQYKKYKDSLWEELFGHSIKKLWEKYGSTFDHDGDDNENNDSSEREPVPTS